MTFAVDFSDSLSVDRPVGDPGRRADEGLHRGVLGGCIPAAARHSRLKGRHEYGDGGTEDR